MGEIRWKAGVVLGAAALGWLLPVPGPANAAAGVTIAFSGPLVTTEAGTTADRNALLIFRFYDNTFEHRYIGSQTKLVVIDDDASIRVNIN